MLRNLVLGAASALALVVAAGAASAADLPAYEPAPVVAVPSFSWTGFYIGAQAGYGWGETKVRAFGARGKADLDGFIVGGYAGYNVQLDGSPVVLGIETDFNYTDIDEKRTVLGARVRAETNWAGATRARIGYAFDRFLVYAAGGVAYADREFKVNAGRLGSYKDSKTALGWTVGGGVEYAATDNVAVRVDYRYTDYGRDRFSSRGFSASADYTEHRVMGGVSYKFDTFGF